MALSAVNPLLEELATIQARFEDCKVMHNIGNIACILDVPFKNFGTTVKFQIEDTYPNTSPQMIVKSTDLSLQQRAEMENVLKDTCHLLLDDSNGSDCKPLLLNLIDSADVWLQANCVDYAGSGEKASPPLIKDGHRGHAKGPKKERPPESATQQRGEKANRTNRDDLSGTAAGGKKPPMRTADDVIKRITWDKSLSADRFSIGYTDRFVGILEKPFSDFSWENLASVDQSVLAIPRHRIEYFKCDGVKVWEKSTRLDNVFGSTGSGLTIADAPAPCATSVAAASTACDASSDNQNGRASTHEPMAGSDTNAQERPRAVREKRYQKTKPNYFVCLRVTAPEIVSKVAALQADLAQRRPELAQYLHPPSRLHVTLAVVHLPVTTPAVDRVFGDDPAEANALSALSEAVHSFSGGPIKLSVAGVGQFTRRVLYAQLRPSTELDDFVRTVRAGLVSQGVTVYDEEFVPHVTIAKLPVSTARGSRLCIDVSDVATGTAANETVFGEDSVDSVHLCSFLKDHIDNADFYISGVAELPKRTD